MSAALCILAAWTIVICDVGHQQWKRQIIGGVADCFVCCNLAGGGHCSVNAHGSRSAEIERNEIAQHRM
jgi:hypothetical protein